MKKIFGFDITFFGNRKNIDLTVSDPRGMTSEEVSKREQAMKKSFPGLTHRTTLKTTQ